MKITELNARFIRRNEQGFENVDTIAEAEGLLFVCPVCYKAEGNTTVGAHSIICWRPSVPQNIDPKPGRWEFVGTSLDDLTLTAAASSIFLTVPGCGAHFYIRNGEIA
jgi:hypothetical protein